MVSSLVIAVVFVFDVIAFSLAVAAEQRRNTATTVDDPTNNSRYCRYDSDIATGLGVGSFLFLLAGQLLIMAATRCLCCGKALRPSSSRTWAIVLFITCWLGQSVLYPIMPVKASEIQIASALNYYSEVRRFNGRYDLILSFRVFFIIAEICLLAGSVRNAYHTKYSTLLPNPAPSCATLRKGIFGAGAAFVFFTGIVSVLFYLSHSKAKGTPAPYARDSGIRMGSL